MIRIEYDSILIIIKRLICYRIFIPYIKASIAKDLIYIINKFVIAIYRMIKE